MSQQIRFDQPIPIVTVRRNEIHIHQTQCVYRRRCDVSAVQPAHVSFMGDEENLTQQEIQPDDQHRTCKAKQQPDGWSYQ